jgi:hypothetical protein
VEFTTHPQIGPRLNKEYSYASTPFLELHGLLHGEIYIFSNCSMVSQIVVSVPLQVWNHCVLVRGRNKKIFTLKGKQFLKNT